MQYRGSKFSSVQLGEYFKLEENGKLFKKYTHESAITGTGASQKETVFDSDITVLIAVRSVGNIQTQKKPTVVRGRSID